MSKQVRKLLVVFLAAVVLFQCVDGKMAEAAAADTVKAACAAALKATGNKDKLKNKSTSGEDFDGIPYGFGKKLSAVFLVTDNKSVYNICVAKTKTEKDAKSLQKSFASYKKQRIKDPYLKTDYSKTEQGIVKNAIYGRKGTYVWYISMSSKKKNLAGEKALKKKL